MKPYDLKELLDLVCFHKAVALYLIEGFAPMIATSGEISDDLKYDLPRERLSTALLNTVEGPALKVEDLKLLVEEIRSKCSEGKFIDSREVAEFRYHQDSHDFDVFLFARGDRIFVEFRQPNKYYKKGHA